MNTTEQDFGTSVLEGIADRIQRKQKRLDDIQEKLVQLSSEADQLAQEVDLDRRALELLKDELRQRAAATPVAPEGKNGRVPSLLDPVDDQDEGASGDFPAGGYDIAKVNFALSQLGCFSVKRDIENVVKRHDPALSKYWASNALSYLVKERQLVRAQVADRGKRFFYGRLDWVESTHDGLRLKNPQLAPRTRGGQPASERSVIFNNEPEQTTAASEG